MKDDIKQRKTFLFAAAMVSIAALTWMWTYAKFQFGYYDSSMEIPAQIESIMTCYTTRVQGKNQYETAVAVSQLIYPGIFEDDHPNGAILVSEENLADVLIAARLMKQPIDAPILYTRKDQIPQETRNELERLRMQGVSVDRNIRVIAIGDMEDAVIKDLEKSKYGIRHIQAQNAIELAEKVDAYISTLQGSFSGNIMVVDIHHPEYGIPGAFWSAYTGDPILYVDGNEIPEGTKRALEKRGKKSRLYLMGPEGIVSEEVALKLSDYGTIERIAGNTPQELSGNFAAFRSRGKSGEGWAANKASEFGWGLTNAGHHYTFGTTEQWMSLMPAAGLAQRGGYSPVILIEKNEIPREIESYLSTVKPAYSGAMSQVFNHGWILGDEESISKELQAQISDILQIERNVVIK